MSKEASTAFNDHQFDAIYPPGVEHHYWNIARNRVIARMLRKSRAEGPMLEVGCGRGLVVKYLRDEGFDITGVELAPLTPLAGMEAYVRTGIDALTMDHVDTDHVRTLLLLDVIEHLEDPEAFLAALCRKFTALTTVVVTVPARQELFSNFDRFNGHFRRYDPATLRSHLVSISPSRVMMGYFCHALYPSAKVLLRLRGERPERFDAPTSGAGKILHALIGRAMFIEYLVLPARWRGTSLIAAARR